MLSSKRIYNVRDAVGAQDAAMSVCVGSGRKKSHLSICPRGELIIAPQG